MSGNLAMKNAVKKARWQGCEQDDDIDEKDDHDEDNQDEEQDSRDEERAPKTMAGPLSRHEA